MPPFQWLTNVAALCRDVYQHTPVSVTMGVMAIQDMRYGSDYGCAYITEGTTYIAIRGSDDWQDWQSNLKAAGRTDWYGIAAHRGFARAARGMEQAVLDIVSENSGKRIVFCGHSRGGAIALLLAIAAEKHYPAMVVQCITFGQPRVSSEKQIRGAFSGSYIRVQNGSDAVCRWPKLGYSHAGTCLYLTNRGDNKWIIDPSLAALLKDQTVQIWKHAKNHSMQRYAQELSACIPESPFRGERLDDALTP
jgi:pimeloyl-ACP methyl ester carboxylesterase